MELNQNQTQEQSQNKIPGTPLQPDPKLPHLVVEEPKRGVAGTLGVVVLSLMLLAIPVGIFLVSQQTQLAPQAAVTEESPEVVSGIFLESKLSPEARGGIVPVDVYVKSPLDDINLVNAKISFDPGVINVEKIATGGAELSQQSFFNKWIEVSFDNEKGDISLISGLPSPGLKTTGTTGDKVYLATLMLKPVQSGTAILQVTPESQILRNSDNNNIFKTGNDLVLSSLSASGEANVEVTPGPSGDDEQEAEDEPLLVLTSPETAANYSYFKPVNISWSSFNVERISKINLHVNGELLGSITQNIDAQDGQFSWQPQDTLALPYVQPTSIFTVELIGVADDDQIISVFSGPFGILGTEDVAGGPPNQESFSQNQLSVIDASRIFSNYLVLPLNDKSLDLNNDDVINDLDLFLLRQNLLVRGVIR